MPGDEVTRIDGTPVADVLAAEARLRADARPESARVAFAKTWTAVLVAKGDAPRARSIDVARRAGGDVHIAITPKPPASPKREVVAIAHRGDVAIVTIKSLEGGKARAAAIDAVLAEARGAKAIVLDLRGNRGGIDKVGFRVVAGLAEGTARLGSYRVLAAPETLARRPMWKDLVAEADGFSAPQPLTVPALPARFAGKLALVVDAGCISTCEIVTAALRADLGATIVGEITGGSSGAPVSVALPASKGTIQIPTWNLIAADGKPIEDDGVVPDIDAIATPDALAAGRDLPLETAIDRVHP
jgi:C-terminal processing protease CtpA/Prc